MTTNIQRGSAKIYQFPVGGRAGLNRTKPNTTFSPSRSSEFAEGILVGSSWYHDEAIKDAEHARKSRQ